MRYYDIGFVSRGVRYIWCLRLPPSNEKITGILWSHITSMPKLKRLNRASFFFRIGSKKICAFCLHFHHHLCFLSVGLNNGHQTNNNNNNNNKMIGYTDRTAGAVEHCESMIQQHHGSSAVVVQTYEKLVDGLQRKLWHQCTLLLLDMLQQPTVFHNHTTSTTTDQDHDSFLGLYDKVVLCIESKLNPLSVAQMAALVAQAIQPLDETAAKAILENWLAAKKSTSGTNNNNNAEGADSSTGLLSSNLVVPATIYLQSKLTSLQLISLDTDTSSLSNPKSLLSSMLKTLKSNKDLLHTFPAEGNSQLALVHAAHYEAAMLYYKRMGPPEAFYEQALSYLQHVGPDFVQSKAASTMGWIRPVELAVDLIVAALTGEGVYNLGQVEQTPVLKVLQSQGNNDDDKSQSSHVWLVHLLQAMAAGNVALFRQYQQDYASQIAQQPALVHRAAAVTEKLSLLALVNLVFTKPPHERQLSFEEIAQTLLLTKDDDDSSLNVDQVEWIVMRALSVHLMEAFMDQVAQTVTVTWVMPRVLNTTQLEQLAQRFGEWASTVSQTQESVTAAIA